MGSVGLRNRVGIGIGIGVLVGILNGLLAVGGTLLVPALVHVLDLDQHHSHGTSLWIILPTSVVSLYIYAVRNGIALDVGWKVAAGGAIGAFLGAKLLKYVSGVWLKRLFATFMMIAALRMVIG